jgi:pSer/pThr/pTyr-binding forkhead associated (FHA) protein
MVHVLDLSSVNGTFLNGQRLTPEVPYPVRTGDKLRLGNFNIQLSRRDGE